MTKKLVIGLSLLTFAGLVIAAQKVTERQFKEWKDAIVKEAIAQTAALDWTSDPKLKNKTLSQLDIQQVSQLLLQLRADKTDCAMRLAELRDAVQMATGR